MRERHSADNKALAGSLLLAHPSMRDGNFRRAVVLLSAHDEKGAMGVVLNRPLGKRLGQRTRAGHQRHDKIQKLAINLSAVAKRINIRVACLQQAIDDDAAIDDKTSVFCQRCIGANTNG